MITFPPPARKYFEQYKSLLSLLSKDPSAGAMKMGLPFAGGISKSRIEENANDTDVNFNPFANALNFNGTGSDTGETDFDPRSFRG